MVIMSMVEACILQWEVENVNTSKLALVSIALS